jgi:hypothetical protein
MDEVSRKRELSKVPTRKLLAAVKRDIRKELQPTASAGKPQKKK